MPNGIDSGDTRDLPEKSLPRSASSESPGSAIPSSPSPSDPSRPSAADLSGLIRIEATSYREALRTIGERFGQDVSIVATRAIRRKGVLGALGARGVEVYVTARSEVVARSEAQSEGESTDWPGAVLETRPEEPKGELRRRPLETRRADAPRPEIVPSSETPPTESELLGLLREVHGQVRDLVRQEGESTPEVESHPLLIEARRTLARVDVAPSLVEELIGKLARRQLPGTSGRPEEVRTLTRIHLGELLRKKIPPCVPIKVGPDGGSPRVVAVVGPTGVGKTTTVAKLASPFHLQKRCRVGLVTLDTYRIGAVDQLRRFAEILGLELEVVPPGGHLRKALEKLGGCDVVFVDTAGRSQRDGNRLSETHEVLQGIDDLEVHLCISMAASRATNLEVIENFRAVPYDRLLVTKLDEAGSPGVLLDYFQAAKTPVSYLTCGQEVPDDIRPASVDRIEALLLGD